MTRASITLTISIERDSVPGAFHHAEDFLELLIAVLVNRVDHYNPVIEVAKINKENFTHRARNTMRLVRRRKQERNT
tara:strand:- start:38590 stop:38820 length:231 start_codon:yes stop_codon:yes gene_type:complete